MKVFFLSFLVALSIVGCQNSQTERASENSKPLPAQTNSTQLEDLEIPIFSIENLSEVKREKFDKLLPPKARDFLAGSEEVKIVVRRQGDLLGQGQTVDLKDNELRMKLLNAFYIDVAESIPDGDYTHIACVSPHHLIKAKSRREKLEIEISYNSIKFYLTGDYGYSTGFMKRRNESVSVKVFNHIIEKYNSDIK